MPVEIRNFDDKNASEDAYNALHKCWNQIRAEQLPDDPPIPMDELVQWLTNFPSDIEVTFWTAWDRHGAHIVAYSFILFSNEDNLHMAQFMIDVLPEFRRQGIGREFLSRIVDVAEGENRRLLITRTTDRIPAGETFMKRIGARKGLEGHTNQLEIADLDRNLLSQWQERAKERGAGFEIGIWEGEYPEEYMDGIVELYQLINQQPFGDLEMEDFSFTAENIRQREKSLFARGNERWTLFAREKETGKFAGYTEVYWNSNRPEIISQDMTGVFPVYRNKGLGRWLKAAMLDRILAKRPQAKYVRTLNADMNAPMKKINTELGFKPYIAETAWQVETEKVSEYLAQHA